jgi:PAS domain S-box-containing protein
MYDQVALERLYQALVQNTPDALLIIRRGEQQYSLANAAAEALLGYDREELLQLGPADVTAPEDLPALLLAYTQLNKTGHWRGRFRLRHRDGTLVPTDASVTAIDIGDQPVFQGLFRPSVAPGAPLSAPSHRAARPRSDGRAVAMFVAEAHADGTAGTWRLVTVDIPHDTPPADVEACAEERLTELLGQGSAVYWRVWDIPDLDAPTDSPTNGST